MTATNHRERQELAREINEMSERLGIIATRLQNRLGRESPLGRQAQEAAEKISILGRDLQQE